MVLSLLALAILPDTVARRVARLQQEVSQRVTPVRNELHTFGLAFAREVLAFRAWALTGDAGFAEEYRRSAEDADRANEKILDSVNLSGEAFLSHTKLGGRTVLRLAIGNVRTEERHVQKAWDQIRNAVGLVNR